MGAVCYYIPVYLHSLFILLSSVFAFLIYFLELPVIGCLWYQDRPWYRPVLPILCAFKQIQGQWSVLFCPLAPANIRVCLNW